MSKIIEAEVMSAGKTKLRITLSNGDVIEGYSLGIEPAFDDNGEELDYNILSFRAYAPEAYFELRSEDIEKIEKVA
jgi:hypothetical protein